MGNTDSALYNKHVLLTFYLYLNALTKNRLNAWLEKNALIFNRFLFSVLFGKISKIIYILSSDNWLPHIVFLLASIASIFSLHK